MTIPSEELQALKRSRNFLVDLINPVLTPRVPPYIRHAARDCVKHYPFDHVIEEVWKRRIREWKLLLKKNPRKKKRSNK